MLSAVDIEQLRDFYAYLYTDEDEAARKFATRLAEIVAIGQPVSRPYPTPKRGFIAPVI